MLKKLINKFFLILLGAKYHYEDRLMFVYCSNGKRKIFQGSGVFWTNLETRERCDIRMIDILTKIKIKINLTGEAYVKKNME